MKNLKDFESQIHQCSKCGICQSTCPIYKVTGNDCSVSRGLFNMLRGVLINELKMTKTINRYLNLCLKCDRCSKACPSGVDVVDVIVSAKHEFFKNSLFDKLFALVQKKIIFGLIPNFLSIFQKKYNSLTFDKKVIYYGGCGSKIKGTRAVVELLNKAGIEVITPKFDCCGISIWAQGDLEGFEDYINNFIKVLKHYDTKEIVTTCASCEKTIKSYAKWTNSKENKEFLNSLKIKNIYEHIRENNIKFKLKKPIKITYHKPCGLDNFEDIEWILNNTENLEYIKMDNFDNCCGLNGLYKFNELNIMRKIFKQKRDSIIKSKADCVLTSCLGCEIAMKIYSFGKYKVFDLARFLSKMV